MQRELEVAVRDGLRLVVPSFDRDRQSFRETSVEAKHGLIGRSEIPQVESRRVLKAPSSNELIRDIGRLL